MVMDKNPEELDDELLESLAEVDIDPLTAALDVMEQVDAYIGSDQQAEDLEQAREKGI